MARVNGENWIKSILKWLDPAEHSDGEALADRIELRFNSREGSPIVASFRVVEGDDYTDDVVRKKVAEFISQAQEESNEQFGPGPFVYYVTASLDGEVIARSTPKKFMNETFDGSEMALTSPTASGVTEMMMRHTETMFKAFVSGSSRQIETLASTVQRYAEREGEIMARQDAARQALEDARNEEFQRRIQLSREEKSQERQDQIFGQLQRVFLPALKSKLLAGKSGGVKTDATSEKMVEIFDRFWSNLPPEKAQGLLDLLGQDALPLGEFMELVDKIQRQRAASEAAE